MKKLLLTFCVLFLSGCGSAISQEKTTVRIGYFPNITHAPALIGFAQGQFEKELGAVEGKIFNAGPAEIEALFAGEIDLAYIGPGPAINGYIKSQGQALQIISGLASGGASLVVQTDLASDFKNRGAAALAGKKIASPQQGNTQDIALRHWLKTNGLEGKAEVVPLANADQLNLFKQKKLDGAWAPEPWASRLILEGEGKAIIDERELWPNKKFSSTVIIVSPAFAKAHPELVKKFLNVNQSIIAWLQANPDLAKEQANQGIAAATSKQLSSNVLDQSWSTLNFSLDPLTDSIKAVADHAFDQGFLGATKPSLDNLFDLNLVNEITHQQYK